MELWVFLLLGQIVLIFDCLLYVLTQTAQRAKNKIENKLNRISHLSMFDRQISALKIYDHESFTLGFATVLGNIDLVALTIMNEQI